MRWAPRFFSFAMLALGCTLPAWAAKETFYPVGVAQVDITPAYPIRLSGYGARLKESEGIDQHLFAQALAIGGDKRNLAVLITVDNVAVPAYLRNEVAARLAKQAGLRNERFALCSTHTHTAPMLAGACANIFGADLPADQQERVDRYTRALTDQLEGVALAAIKDRQPAILAWGQSQAGFAANRRTKGGPADHDLPVLVTPGNTSSAIIRGPWCSWRWAVAATPIPARGATSSSPSNTAAPFAPPSMSWRGSP
jgi:hypothetical protein